MYFNIRHISSYFFTILQYHDALLKLLCAVVNPNKFYYSYQYVLDVSVLLTIFRHVLKHLRIVSTTETCSFY
jgi:hypothetical protein